MMIYFIGRLLLWDLQKHVISIECQTIEYFAELILDRLQLLYGLVPMKVVLRKSYAPIPGFDGIVGVEMTRNFPTEKSSIAH